MRHTKYEGLHPEFQFCSVERSVWNHSGHLTEH